jgi:hypothetical protein
MATRSNIGIDNGNGTFITVYCHWDGYLSHNGQILLDHFDSEQGARKIVEAGELRSLNADLDDSFDKEKYKARTLPASKALEHEYLYLWRKGKWYFRSHFNIEFEELTHDKCQD